MFITESYIDGILEEGKKARTTRTVRSKDTKIKAAGGKAMLLMAKKANDPMFKKYIGLRRKALATKAKMRLKYGRKGYRLAKSKMF